MNREPLGLYIFRFVMGLGLFAFMAMLYWSSLLIEQDLKRLHTHLSAFDGQMQEIRQQTQRLRTDVMKGLAEAPRLGSGNTSAIATALSNRAHIDPSLPNLLNEDPFYAETLASLLPEDFTPDGIRQQATVGRPEDLHPFSAWRDVSGWTSLCGVSLAGGEFGKYETFTPDMAIKIEQRSADTFWVHLRDDVYWQALQPEHFPEDVVLAPHFLKKHQVTAGDFKFFWDAMMNPHHQEPGAMSLRNYLGDIEELRVVDDLTLVVRWATEEVDGTERIKYIAKGWTGSLRPLAAWVYQYFPDGSKILEDDTDPDTYRTNSVWAQNFAQHWAKNVIPSCGAWIFGGMTDNKIVFRRNPDHFQPLDVLVKEQEIRFKESPDGVWQDFMAGSLDNHTLPPDKLLELGDFLASGDYLEQASKGRAIHRLDYVARAYSYIAWNQATPFFTSQKVRQAMTLAIDRDRIIQQNLNGMGIPITGPFFANSPSNDSSIEQWPYDPQQARQILDEEGWYDVDGSGVREKMLDGKSVSFRFKLTYYVKNPTSKAICEYVAIALKEVGISCELLGVDITDISASFEEKSFDALLMGWALGTPPEEPRQLWHSDGALEKGSSNAVGFANEEADKIIEELQYEYDKDDRLKLYHRFHRIIHEEQPYTFLYTPKSIFLYRDYVQNVFIPAERQDIIPGANVAEPSSSIFWLKKLN